ncbi:hypothetical protein RHGRI_027700 [Rhododendron griersonianum]|uniref:Uncharacterized protein n=1 Tax=Rhododendron griersonianum TaxID=479676 RepID=A0AAV6J4H0_9ERIC|nr:hypothetical protein RHGRI_027700 [Rhododendron griersonianum]
MTPRYTRPTSLSQSTSGLYCATSINRRRRGTPPVMNSAKRCRFAELALTVVSRLYLNLE